MINGQWNLQFISPIRRVDAGTIEFEDNKFHGGDINYRCMGEVDLTNDMLDGELTVVGRKENSHMIFGFQDQCKILLHGRVESSSMDLTGYMANNPLVKIKVQCTKIAGSQ